MDEKSKSDLEIIFGFTALVISFFGLLIQFLAWRQPRSPSAVGEWASNVSPASKPKYGCLFWGGIAFFLFMGIGFLSDKYDSKNSNSDENNRKAANVSDSSGSNRGCSSNGRTGRLTTNLNLRSAPNKTASSVGIHFQNARVRILDEKSFKMPDGYSTWYKVEVVEYGCDTQEGLGCGKSSNSDADIGWLNASLLTGGFEIH